MSQETTQEFGARLRQAVEGHPLAPPSPHGRQSWLRELLEREAKRTVSANTVHKWIHGTARPRPDAVRDIAKVLHVDEVWLSLGRKPLSIDKKPGTDAGSASGATLLVAGLVEMGGGKASFSSDENNPVSLWADMGGRRTGLVVVSPQSEKDGVIAFIVPEPVGEHRVVAVVDPGKTGVASACIDLLDLTDVERQNLGGFSVVQLTRKSAREYAQDGTKVVPLAGVAAVA